MTRTTTTLVFAILIVSPVSAEAPVDVELKKDVVLRAMVDELQRSIERLKLEDLERPYFIEYGLSDSASASASARLGAATGKNTNRIRILRTEVRVGSYELDNTNFQGDRSSFMFGGSFGGFGGASVPIEDDYTAIRQAIWWSTDRQYKSATETLERKKAFMESKMIEDKPADFSKENPTVHFDERVRPELDAEPLEKLAVELSAVFRDSPAVQESSVSINAAEGNRYIVNSEGTRLRTGSSRCSVTVNATVQSDDGMKLSDTLGFFAPSFEELPPVAEMSAKCREMAGRLLELRNAPKIESYTGPVMFDAKAAAQIFAQQFGARFAGGQRPVGGQASPEDFEKKLGERILPKFLSVTDDPTQERIDGKFAAGHYDYDDQGVKARPVKLVEDGKLAGLVMSRNPSKKFSESTGHGNGSFRPTASTAVLIVSAEDGEDAASLKTQLIEAAQEAGLEFGLRVSSLGSAADGDRMSRLSEMFAGMGMDFGGMRGGTTPLAMYKVFPDGREELIRGAELARLEIKAFKKILAAGAERYVANSTGSPGRTVAAPALLFEELDFTKIDRDFDKPPIIETPLARK